MLDAWCLLGAEAEGSTQQRGYPSKHQAMPSLMGAALGLAAMLLLSLCSCCLLPAAWCLVLPGYLVLLGAEAEGSTQQRGRGHCLVLGAWCYLELMLKVKGGWVSPPP